MMTIVPSHLSRWFCLVLFLSCLHVTVVTGSLEGIELPDVRHVNGIQLTRNGQGVRSISFLGMDIKVYVAGFYSQIPLRNENDILLAKFQDNNDDMNDSSSSPIMQLEFTFLRSINKSRVSTAWSKQLESSVSYRYDGYENDRDLFISMLGAIEYKGTETVLLMDDNTVIVDQGEYKGMIPGRNFQRAFLSMWFGEKAVAEDLKTGLLSGGFYGQQHQQKQQIVEV